MKASKVTALVCAVAVLAGGGGYYLGSRSQSGNITPIESAEEKTVSSVIEVIESAAESAAEVAESAENSSAEAADNTISGQQSAAEQSDSDENASGADGQADASENAQNGGTQSTASGNAQNGGTQSTASGNAQNGGTQSTASGKSQNGGAQNSAEAPEYSLTISTDYGNLYFPDQWEDYLATEQSASGNTLTVAFYAEISGQKIHMFDAVIGSGDAIGTLTGPDGTQRNVGFASYDTSSVSGLTQDEQNRLNAMSEDINFVIDSLA